MQIGLLTIGPVATQREVRSVASGQAEEREKISSYLPWDKNSGNWGSRDNNVDIMTTVRELEHTSHTINKRLRFVVDHETHEVIVKVIDSETDKVIKVLPPEELQKLHGRIRETFGFLFDQLI